MSNIEKLTGLFNPGADANDLHRLSTSARISRFLKGGVVVDAFNNCGPEMKNLSLEVLSMFPFSCASLTPKYENEFIRIFEARKPRLIAGGNIFPFLTVVVRERTQATASAARHIFRCVLDSIYFDLDSVCISFLTRLEKFSNKFQDQVVRPFGNRFNGNQNQINAHLSSVEAGVFGLGRSFNFGRANSLKPMFQRQSEAL